MRAPAGVGGRLRARGRCGAEGRFFKEKAPQKPFWERFLGYPVGWVQTWRFPCRRGRAQYLPMAKTVSGGRLFGGPIYVLEKFVVEVKIFDTLNERGFL